MKKILLVLGIIGTFLFTGCGGSDKGNGGSGEKKTTFVMGTSNFNGDFYRGWTNTVYDANVRRLVWGSGLLALTDKGELVLSSFVEERTLAKSTPDAPAEDIWTFKLKDGAKFSNGDPLTVKDVKFTYDFYMDKEALGATGGTSSLDQYISKIEIDESENTIVFYLKEVIYTVDYSAFGHEQYILNSTHILAGAEKDGVTPQQWVKANMSTPIGYGPYKIDEYVESQYVKLSINENYLGNFQGVKPGIDILILQNVPNETQLTQLLSGEVDGLTGLTNEEEIDPVRNESSLNTNNYFRHGGGQITFHTDYGPVQLPEVRKAFAYQFDRVKFRDLFLGKYGIASNAQYSRNQWMMYDEGEELGSEGKFERSLISYDILDSAGNWDEEANLAEAHRLLDQAAEKTEGEYAKLTKSGDKYLWEGKELTLNLAISSFWADALNLTITEENQKKFGIKVNLYSMDWSIMASHLYGSAALSERKYHMFTGGTSYTLKSNPYTNWSETRILPFGQGSSSNSARYSGYDDLLTDIRSSNPTTEEGTISYKTKWREWIKILNQELPLLPLYSNNYYDAYTNKLVNFKTNALYQWPYAIIEASLED